MPGGADGRNAFWHNDEVLVGLVDDPPSILVDENVLAGVNARRILYNNHWLNPLLDIGRVAQTHEPQQQPEDKRSQNHGRQEQLGIEPVVLIYLEDVLLFAISINFVLDPVPDAIPVLVHILHIHFHLRVHAVFVLVVDAVEGHAHEGAVDGEFVENEDAEDAGVIEGISEAHVHAVEQDGGRNAYNLADQTPPRLDVVGDNKGESDAVEEEDEVDGADLGGVLP